MARATVSPTFHTRWRGVMEFENVSRQGSGRSIVIDFQTMNIHAGLYVGKPREEAHKSTGRTLISEDVGNRGIITT